MYIFFIYIDKGNNLHKIWSTKTHNNASRFVNIWNKSSIYPSFYWLDIELSENV